MDGMKSGGVGLNDQSAVPRIRQLPQPFLLNMSSMYSVLSTFHVFSHIVGKAFLSEFSHGPIVRHE